MKEQTKKIIKIILIGMVMIFLLPILKVHAVDVVISQKDLDEAKSNPDVVTSKGIVYKVNVVEDGPQITFGNVFSLPEGNIKISENINLEDDAFYFKNVTSTIDFSGYTVTSKKYVVGMCDSKVTIKGGTFTNLEEKNSYSMTINVADSDLIIDGGTFINNQNVSAVSGYNSNIKINKGDYQSKGNTIEARNCNLEINGGTSSANGKENLCNALYVEGGKTIINGGLFNGDVDIMTLELTINDGIFESSFDIYNLTEEAVVNINGGKFNKGLYISDYGATTSIAGGIFKDDDLMYALEIGDNDNDGKINLKLLGGTFSSEWSSIVIFSKKIEKFSIHELLKDGYKFTSSEENESYLADPDDKYSQGALWLVAKSTSVVPIEAEKYTVTFNTNGGNSIDSVLVEKGKKVSEPTNPTKEGFMFLGWYSDIGLTAKYNFDTTVTSNINLYSKWEENTKSIKYKFIKGENQNYTIGKDETAVFEIDANYELFKNGGKVYIDEKQIDPSNYNSNSGSTIISFKNDFMDSLSENKHILKVVFNDNGIATCDFNVLKIKEEEPNKDENNGQVSNEKEENKEKVKEETKEETKEEVKEEIKEEAKTDVKDEVQKEIKENVKDNNAKDSSKEEKNISDNKTKEDNNPQTGDNGIIIWYILMGISVVGIIITNKLRN